MKENINPSGKLLCHLSRLHDWYNGDNVAPILVEINSTDTCNHKCSWCLFADYHGKTKIKEKVLTEFLDDFKEIGGLAVNWTGGGEPLCYPSFAFILDYANQLGLKQGLFTNGQLLTLTLQRLAVNFLSWIRFSIDASNPISYQQVHGVNGFKQTIDNLRSLVKIRNENESDLVIGVCMTIAMDNINEVYELGLLCQNLGVDYYQVRPVLNKAGQPQIGEAFWKQIVIPQIERCSELKINFKYTRYKFEELLGTELRGYDKCYGGQFCPSIDSNGDVLNCMYFMKNNDYVLGNLYKNRFKEIWNNSWQERIAKIDISKCQRLCKLNEINKTLYIIKHQPFEHINFL